MCCQSKQTFTFHDLELHCWTYRAKWCQTGQTRDAFWPGAAGDPESAGGYETQGARDDTEHRRSHPSPRITTVYSLDSIV
ncbi:hypothetical protein M8818_006685 [Zalaria obscura]|uniref:Uncharacterized protein n=1 Tax=Zalaria obscura TaxID=2024903 RepID=A0ACC3S918_9PEZI